MRSAAPRSVAGRVEAFPEHRSPQPDPIPARPLRENDMEQARRRAGQGPDSHSIPILAGGRSDAADAERRADQSLQSEVRILHQPTSPRTRGLMSDATFDHLEGELRAGGVWIVSLCGNGEPTLHPRFAEYVGRLARSAPYVTVTSNWQRIDDEIAVASLRSARRSTYRSTARAVRSTNAGDPVGRSRLCSGTCDA